MHGLLHESPLNNLLKMLTMPSVFDMMKNKKGNSHILFYYANIVLLRLHYVITAILKVLVPCLPHMVGSRFLKSDICFFPQ